VGFPSPKLTFPPELLVNHRLNDRIFIINNKYYIPAYLANRGYLAALSRALFLTPLLPGVTSGLGTTRQGCTGTPAVRTLISIAGI
jgi:hypothetical protein